MPNSEHNAELEAPERVCPKCHYPTITKDRQGWLCLNGGCGRFDQPLLFDSRPPQENGYMDDWQKLQQAEERELDLLAKIGKLERLLDDAVNGCSMEWIIERRALIDGYDHQ